MLSGFDLVLAPLALGGHIDHRIAREAVRNIVAAPSLGFYEDLPYACRMTQAQHDSDAAGSLAPANFPQRLLLRIPGAAHQKREFAAIYTSQIAMEVADEMQAYVTALRDGERYWITAEAAGRLASQLKGRATLHVDTGD